MSKNRKTGGAEAQIQNLRVKIDALDEKIQALISARARLAVAVAEIKQQSGNNNFYRPEREAEVLRNVLARDRGPLTEEAMLRLFRELMSACLALESRMRIAFFGPEGTFTQEATLKHFGHSVDTVPLAAIDEVFRDVESGNSHFGVVPVENSTEGAINHTLDMLMTSPLKICGEVNLRIHHHLLGKGNDPNGARRLVSHQQSLAQCREWLDANLPGVERVAVASNAEAARLASEEISTIAIAGDSAARLYGLHMFAANIEDRPDNTTRFLVIGTIETASSGNDKTSLLLSSRNRPGALQRLLAPLAKNGINMTRIESRPSRQSMWEYVFFVDIDGHVKDRKVAKALTDLETEAAFLKRLGSYPKAVM
ncbi:MAG: prephenate dehydratase [Sulfuricaulis sp.]